MRGTTTRFFLDTSDAGEVRFSTEQMHFLTEGLKVPIGRCVVILGHKCLHPTIGKWKGQRPGTIKNGISFIVTQGYGTISANDLPDRGDYVTPVDRTQTMLVDVVAVKPACREMMIFRIGAGGAQRDRAFHF